MDKKELSLENVIPEEELLKLFGIKKAGLGDLRRRHKLPFLKIDNQRRVYLEQDVIEWLLNRRKVLNSSETVNNSHSDDIDND